MPTRIGINGFGRIGRHEPDDAQQRHRARIAAKKVRYATEFFQSLYSSKLAPPYIASLTALQGALGSINDATVAASLLAQLVETRPDLAQHTGFVRGYLAAGAEQDVRKLGKLWQQFQAIPLPCRK